MPAPRRKPEQQPPPARDRTFTVDLDELGPVGLSLFPLEQRTALIGGPGAALASAGATAEAARGAGPADLIVVAVTPGRGRDVVALLKAELAGVG